MGLNRSSCSLPVSIHAPARGATQKSVWTGYTRCFNPRPRAGGDKAGRGPLPGCYCFNPRPRAGGDTRLLYVKILSKKVSIHAPARGATKGTLENQWLEMFQSTPPRGGRRSLESSRLSTGCFNPRPRAGGDDRGSHWARWFMVSIHAPARGATHLVHTAGTQEPFQSTPPRGGRREVDDACLKNAKFQSTPPRGGRLRVS